VIWWRKRRARLRIRQTVATRASGRFAPAE
jgi:hypothetical protein